MVEFIGKLRESTTYKCKLLKISYSHTQQYETREKVLSNVLSKRFSSIIRGQILIDFHDILSIKDVS